MIKMQYSNTAQRLKTSREPFSWLIKPLTGSRCSLSKKSVFSFYFWYLQLYPLVLGGLTLSWALLRSYESRSVGWSTQNLPNRYQLDPARKPTQRKFLDGKTVAPRYPYQSKSVILTPTDRLWAFFLQVWSFSRPKSNHHYTVNRHFKMMFLVPDALSGCAGLVSAARYFLRWTDSYDLIYNLFYMRGRSQLLTNKFFTEEALSFNWQYSLKNYRLFKYIQPFFMLKDSEHGEETLTAVGFIMLQRLDFVIISDLKNHSKLLRYLRLKHLYSIGLIPSTYSPWQVSYPVPTFSDSQLDQFYFIRWVASIKQSSEIGYYSDLVNLWRKRSS